jgi:hypothetical protein
MERIERWIQARREHVLFGDRDKLCQVSQAEPMAGRCVCTSNKQQLAQKKRTKDRSSQSVNGGAQISVPTQHGLARDEKQSAMWCGRNMKGADRGMRPARNTEQGAAGLIFRALQNLHNGMYPI